MAAKKETEISVVQINQARFRVAILGTTPLILNRMSEKAKQQLLLPRGRKNAAERASTLKHNPLEEFRASAYTNRDPKAPTYIEHLASAFKGAMKGAALDMPGAKKAQIGRLAYVNGERVSIYGVPKLHMSIVRSADMNKTPDVRTRVIIPHWACFLDVSYTTPLLNEQTVIALLAGAGITQGTGDWRPEKGSGTYGQFTLVEKGDRDFDELVRTGGRAAQKAAMDAAEPYDDDSAELLSWFDAEVKRRGVDGLLRLQEDVENDDGETGEEVDHAAE